VSRLWFVVMIGMARLAACWTAWVKAVVARSRSAGESTGTCG
jgi:hypothetical protein